MSERKTLVRIRTGSHLYGLNTLESDEDFVGVFMPLSEDLLGLQKREEVDLSSKKSSADRKNTKDDIDEKHYALPKYLHLALQNNPNILELLFANGDNLLSTSPVWEELCTHKDKIVCQRVMHSFLGYAHSQKKKIEVKRDRYFSLEQAIGYLEREFFSSELESPVPMSTYVCTNLNSITKYYKGSKGNTEHFHSGMPLNTTYSLLRGEYEKYGWRVKTESFKKLGLDIKFSYHLIRILAEGISLLKTGELNYPITGKAYNDIMRIRNMEVGYDALMGLYDEYNKEVEEAKSITKLPHSPDWKWANKWLIDTVKTSIMEEK